MPDDQIPPGFGKNTPAQVEQLHAVAIAAAQAVEQLGSRAPVGDIDSRRALARLMDVGPETLRQTVVRFMQGHGTTLVVPR